MRVSISFWTGTKPSTWPRPGSVWQVLGSSTVARVLWWRPSMPLDQYKKAYHYGWVAQRSKTVTRGLVMRPVELLLVISMVLLCFEINIKYWSSFQTAIAVVTFAAGTFSWCNLFLILVIKEMSYVLFCMKTFFNTNLSLLRVIKYHYFDIRSKCSMYLMLVGHQVVFWLYQILIFFWALLSKALTK